MLWLNNIMLEYWKVPEQICVWGQVDLPFLLERKLLERSRLSSATIVWACSTRLATAAEKPMSRRGEGERDRGTVWDNEGEGLRGGVGEALPCNVLAALVFTGLCWACSGRNPKEKSAWEGSEGCKEKRLLSALPTDLLIEFQREWIDCDTEVDSEMLVLVVKGDLVLVCLNSVVVLLLIGKIGLKGTPK